LSLGFLRRPLHREIARCETTDGGAINRHRRGRWRDFESRGLVWTARHFSRERNRRLVCARGLRARFHYPASLPGGHHPGRARQGIARLNSKISFVGKAGGFVRAGPAFGTTASPPTEE